MKVIINGIEITSKFKGNRIAPWDQDSTSRANYNHHIIRLLNISTGEYEHFNYWQSLNEVKIKTQAELLLALNCILTDYSIPQYCEDFKDFASQFGYNTEDSRKKGYAVMIWRAVKENAAKVLKVYGSTELIEKTVKDLETIGAC